MAQTAESVRILCEIRGSSSPGAVGAQVLPRTTTEYLLGLGARRLIIGSGQSGVLRLSDEARAFLDEQGCALTVARTPRAIEVYNAAGEPVSAMFHTAC